MNLKFKVITWSLIIIFLGVVLSPSFGAPNPEDGGDQTTPTSSSSSTSASSVNETTTDWANKVHVNFNFTVVNRTVVERNCTKLKLRKCWASDYFLPLCASNSLVYQNPGVLICAQACNKELELENFCDPLGLEQDEMKHCKNCAKKLEKEKAASQAPGGGGDKGVEPETGDKDKKDAKDKSGGTGDTDSDTEDKDSKDPEESKTKKPSKGTGDDDISKAEGNKVPPVESNDLKEASDDKS